MFMYTMHTATPEHLKLLQKFVIDVKSLDGSLLELGCFEGRSSVAICEVAFPEPLICVDNWQGGADGFGADPLAYERFLNNMKEGDCRFLDYKEDMFEYLSNPELKDKFKFIYLDASHDYEGVKKGIEMCLPLLVTGGILCGDDFLNAGRQREDLHGGVQRAVEESFARFSTDGQMWWIVKE